MTAANGDAVVDAATAAKAHFDRFLAGYLDLARLAADRNRHLPPPATWADLAASLTNDIAGHGGLDYALGLLASALTAIVEREGPR